MGEPPADDTGRRISPVLLREDPKATDCGAVPLLGHVAFCVTIGVDVGAGVGVIVITGSEVPPPPPPHAESASTIVAVMAHGRIKDFTCPPSPTGRVQIFGLRRLRGAGFPFRQIIPKQPKRGGGRPGLNARAVAAELQPLRSFVTSRAKG